MNIDNYFNTGEKPSLIFCMFFNLDRMNSVGISELNIVFVFFVLVWTRKESHLENVSVLMFRIV